MAITAEVVPLEDNRVRLDVAVAKDEVDKKMDRTVRRLSREIRVPGFRPGKVPSHIVIQRYGRDAIIDQMLRDSLAEWYMQAVADQGLRPVDDPDVDLPEAPPGDEGFSFTATVQLRPKAVLGPVQGARRRQGRADHRGRRPRRRARPAPRDGRPARGRGAPRRARRLRDRRLRRHRRRRAPRERHRPRLPRGDRRGAPRRRLLRTARRDERGRDQDLPGRLSGDRRAQRALGKDRRVHGRREGRSGQGPAGARR